MAAVLPDARTRGNLALFWCIENTPGDGYWQIVASDGFTAECRSFEEVAATIQEHDPGPPVKKVTRCPARKQRFTESEAQQVVVNARIKRALRGIRHRREDRVYYCGLCDAWHVSSMKTNG